MTLQDDNVLRVYRSVIDAIRDVEALDAEDTYRRVYDEDTRLYLIEWIRPNEESTFLGVRGFVNGEYTLVEEGSRDPSGLLAIIREATRIEPAELESRIRQIEQGLLEALKP